MDSTGRSPWAPSQSSTASCAGRGASARGPGQPPATSTPTDRQRGDGGTDGALAAPPPDEQRDAAHDEHDEQEPHQQDVALLAEVEPGIEQLPAGDDHDDVPDRREGGQRRHRAGRAGHPDDEEHGEDPDDERRRRGARDVDADPAGQRRAERRQVAAVHHEALGGGAVDEQRGEDDDPDRAGRECCRGEHPAPVTAGVAGPQEPGEDPGDRRRRARSV